MSLVYGSGFVPPRLQPARIGKVYKAAGHVPAWLSWLTIIGEIGLTIASGGGAAVATGIALGGATTRLGLAKAYDAKISPLSTGIDFASGLIPGALAGYKNVKFGTQLLSKAEEEGFQGFVKKQLKWDRDYLKDYGGPAKNYYVTKRMVKETTESIKSGITASPFTNTQAQFAASLEKQQFIGFGMFHDPLKVAEYLARSTRKVALAGKTSTEVSEEIVKDLKAAGITEEGIMQLLRELGYVDEIADKAARIKALQLLATLTTESRKVVNQIFVSALGISSEEASALYKVVLQKNSLIRRVWTRVNSSEFYGRDVQYVQAVFDPNDLGRAPIEFMYRKARVRIEEWFEKRAGKFAKQVGEAASKVAKGEAKLERMFEKAGGTVIRSRYLLGIKPLWSFGTGPLKRHKVLVKFRKVATNTKTGKNKGGKKDIVVTMTTKDIMKLTTEGSTYWWRVGKRKGWFYSRGGAPARGAYEVSSKVSLFLGFLPIQAFRAVGSIMSNVSGFAHGLSKGSWQSQYWEKLSGSFIRTLENRSGRLIGNSVLKGVIGTNFKLSNRALYSIGLAGQGVIAAGIHAGQQTTSPYTKTGKLKKRHKSFGGHFKANLFTAAMARGRGELLIKSKGGRLRGRSNIGSALTGQRYLGIARGFVSSAQSIKTGHRLRVKKYRW